MPPWHPMAAHFRRRLVGMYALHVMAEEGPVHGYAISERIAERTDGAWRPGPGSVYPSLQKLVDGGLAKATTQGPRRVYEITPKGRRLLALVRRRGEWFRRPRPDISALWAEIVGNPGAPAFHLLRLRRAIESLESYLSGGSAPPAFRASVVEELSGALGRIEEGAPGGAAGDRTAPELHAR